MATVCELKITNVDLVEKRADLSYTLTDNVSGDVFQKRYKKAPYGIQAQQKIIADDLIAQFNASKTKNTNVETFIAGLEQTAKTYIEGVLNV